MLFFKDTKIKKLIENTVSIDIYYQIPGVLTSKILNKKLYSIKEDSEIQKIIHSLKLRKMHKSWQCKASNYVIFTLKNGSIVESVLDPEGTWIGITTPNGVEFYSLERKSAHLLLNHVEKAKVLYEKEFTL